MTLPGSQFGSHPPRHGAFSDDKRRVLDATDLVRLISDHLALKQKGREFVGLCPFHNDHSPSMYVVPHKQIYHCFVCGAGGDAISFVMNYHKMGFREALEYLAERGGVKLSPPPSRADWRSGRAGAEGEDFDSGAPVVERAALIAANQTASTFFRALLKHAEHGAAARAMIERRGISPAMTEKFELGCAPPAGVWDGLVRTVQGKGLDLEAFRAAGLIKARERGDGFYDSFRNRLMFPIHDQLGRVIAFGGRKIAEEDEPKYLNSPESEVFNKSATLFALHHAADQIRRTRRAIVCEGYTDVIACHQAGVTNVVATLGTAMAAENARMLKRLCDQVVLLFDGDEAGQKAAERAIEVFFAEPVDVRIATLSKWTDAKDPDELLKREGGRAVLERALDGASDPMDVLFDRVKRQVSGSGLSGRSRAVGEFLDRLTQLGLHRVDTIRQQMIIKRLTEITGVEWAAISTEIAQRRARRRAQEVRGGGEPERDERPEAATARSVLSARDHLLGCVMCEPSLQLSLSEEQSPLMDPDAYAPGPMQEVARVIAMLVVDETPPTLRTVLEHLDDPEAQRMATRVATEVDRLTEGDAERLRRHWRDRLRELELEAMRTGAAGAGPDATPLAPSMIVEDKPSSEVEWARRMAAFGEKKRAMGTDTRAVPRAGPV
jgi:DNA primase